MKGLDQDLGYGAQLVRELDADLDAVFVLSGLYQLFET